jgi:hypothetical protein
MPDLFNTAASKVTSIYELAKRFGNAEFLLEISNLQMELAKCQSAYAELLKENTALKSQLNNRDGGSSVGSVPVIRV